MTSPAAPTSSGTIRVSPTAPIIDMPAPYMLTPHMPTTSNARSTPRPPVTSGGTSMNDDVRGNVDE